jgi:hypothetical protein
VQTGDAVELYSAFNRRWVGGFVIAEVLDEGYRVRRSSDGTVLPNTTSSDDVREVTLGRHPSIQP